MLDFETAIECPQSEHMSYVELLLLFGTLLCVDARVVGSQLVVSYPSGTTLAFTYILFSIITSKRRDSFLK